MKPWGICAALLLAVAAGADAGQAADPAKKDAVKKDTRECFLNRDIDSWSVVDRQTVNIRVGVRDYYQLKLLGDCGDIDFDQRIAVRSRGSDFICNPLDAEVIAPSPIGPQTCPVTSIHRFSAEELAAVPAKQKP